MDPQILFIQVLQMNAPDLSLFFQAVSVLGVPEFYMLVIPLIFWCYDRSLGIRLIMLLSISGAICDALKCVFHSPRPYWVSPYVQALGNYPSFGFPSAHAQNAVVFFGLLAVWIHKRWFSLSCIVLVLLIGFARIFQAMHYPTDIIGGYVLGLCILLLYIRYETQVITWITTKPFHFQLAIAFAVSCALILFSYAALFSLGTWQVPKVWSLLALQRSGIPIHPLVPHDTLMSAGLLFGSAAGVILDSRYLHTKITGNWYQKAAFYLIGTAILLFIWFALGMIVHIPGPGGLIMEYTRAVIAGIWITAGAPYLFYLFRRAGGRC